MYCSYCGSVIPEGANFCTNCGAAVTAATAATEVTSTPVQTVVSNPVTVGTYQQVNENVIEGFNVLLLSTGDCPVSIARDLLEDLLGYTEAESATLLRSLPVPVVRNLTEKQATTVARALSEYGMEVSLYDAYGYREVAPFFNSVYRLDGGLLADTAEVLSRIDYANRLTGVLLRRWDYPFAFRGGRPPMILSRNPRRSAYARMQPGWRGLVPGPAARPAPRPAPGPRGPVGGRGAAPMPGPGGRGAGSMGGPGGRGAGSIGGPGGHGAGSMGGPGGRCAGSMGGPGGRGAGPMGGPGGGRRGGGPGGKR